MKESLAITVAVIGIILIGCLAIALAGAIIGVFGWFFGIIIILLLIK